MWKSKNNFALFVLLMCASLLASACGGVQSATSNPAGVSVPNTGMGGGDNASGGFGHMADGV